MTVSKGKEFLYRKINGEIEIVGYAGTELEVVVPNEIDGKKVVSLGVSGKGNMDGVTVILSDTVSSIDFEAISNRHPIGFEEPDEFSWIVDIKVSDHSPYYAKIDDVLYTKDKKTAIFNFGYETKDVVIPEGVEVIGEYAFSRIFDPFLTPDLKSVNFPKSLKRIEKDAFIKCEDLESVTIPENVEFIGDTAFSSNTSIKVLGDNTELGQNVAGNIEIKKSNKKYLVEDGYLISADKKRLLKKIESSVCFKLPSTVEQIDDNALGKYEVAEVELNDGLKRMGHNLFSRSNVKKIEIPATVEYMEADAFEKYFGTNIKLSFCEGNKRFYSDGIAVYHIEDDGTETIFRVENKSITQFVVPTKVKSLDADIFSGCARLKKIVLNEGLVVFDEKCVETQLRNEVEFERIHIPSTVEKIKLIDRKENVGGRLTYSISEKNEHYFIDDDIVYEVNENEEYTVLFCQNRRIRHAVINEGTVKIAKNAFSAKKKWYEHRFDGYDELSCLELPESLRVIEEEAFANCKSLTSVMIPSGVEDISETAFWGCNKLKGISVSKKNKAYSDIDGVLTDKGNKQIIIYPEGRKSDKYEVPETIEYFGQAFASVKCIKTLVLSNNIERICSDAFPSECGIKELHIQNDIKKINEYAFGRSYESKSRDNAIEVSVDPDYYFNSYVIKDMKSPRGDVSIVSLSDTPEMKKAKQMFAYKKIDDGLCITEFLEPSHGEKSSPTITIPGEIGEEPVVELGPGMFGELSYGIETLIISEGIKRIGKAVLFGHSNLKKIVFPESVEYIDAGVFSDLDDEDKDLYVRGSDLSIFVKPESYAEIFIREYEFDCESPRIIIDGQVDYLKFNKDENGYIAKFQDGEEPTEKIVVPAEYRDKSVYKLDISYNEWGDLPETISSIEIAENVSEITGLEKARFQRKCEDGTPCIIVAEGNKAFWSDGIALYSADRKCLIQLIDYTVEEYSVAEGTEVISEKSFKKCLSLKKVILPETVNTIENHVFSQCVNLAEITGLENVAVVGNRVIEGTAIERASEFVIAGKTLTKYNGKNRIAIVPEGVECIGEKAFWSFSFDKNKDVLEEIVLPSTLKYIEIGAFSGRNGLKKINLPEGLLSVKYEAFKNCDSLEALVIPASVTEIEEGALPRKDFFSNCQPGLASITVADGNPKYCSIDNVIYLKDMSEIIYVAYAAKMEEYIIPASVKNVSCFNNKYVTKITIEGELEEMSFSCDSLKCIVFGEKQSVISGFSGCKKLCEVEWPKHVREIQKGAFEGTAIKEIKLPDTVEVIHDEAFANTKIKNFVVPKSVKYIGKEIVSGAIETVTIYDNIDADLFEYNKLIGREEENSRYAYGSFSQVRYIAGGGNKKCNAYRIIVKSAETDEVKFYIDMPSSDSPSDDFIAIVQSWGKGAEFDFHRADGFFGDMKDVRRKYAISRLHMLDTLDEATKDAFVKYLNRSAKTIICNLIDAKDLAEIQYLVQFDLIKKNNIDEIMSYAESKKAKDIIEFLTQYKEDNFAGRKS